MGRLIVIARSTSCRLPSQAAGYDELVDGRFARRTDFAGFAGASVDDGASTTRGDENVRTPWASKSITVWYSFTLLRVPCPYCVCVTRSPGVYFSMSSPMEKRSARTPDVAGSRYTRRAQGNQKRSSFDED